MKRSLLFALMLFFAVSTTFAQTTDTSAVPPPQPQKYQKQETPSTTTTTSTPGTTQTYNPFVNKKNSSPTLTEDVLYLDTAFYQRSSLTVQVSRFAQDNEYLGANGTGGYVQWSNFSEPDEMYLGVWAQGASYKWASNDLQDYPTNWTFAGITKEFAGGLIYHGGSSSSGFNYMSFRAGFFWRKDSLRGGYKDDVKWSAIDVHAGLFAAFETDFYRDERQTLFSRGVVGVMYWRPYLEYTDNAMLNGSPDKNHKPTDVEKWYLYYKQYFLSKKVTRNIGGTFGGIVDYCDEKRGATTWGVGVIGNFFHKYNSVVEFQAKVLLNPSDQSKSGMSIFGLVTVDVVEGIKMIIPEKKKNKKRQP